MYPSLLLETLINHKDLTEDEASVLMNEILNGNLTTAQTAGFLTALRSKGESISEIIGFVKALRNSMIKVAVKSKVLIDTCGTGGDGAGTFNISTAAAFVVAGAGFKVAKHGNRSVSSLCGSADVLEALGIKADMSKAVAERCLEEIGITFLFAPLYHPAMKNVAPVRKELGVRTVFNLLGPLLNPALSNVQIIGVSKPELVPLMTRVLQALQGDRGCAIILHDSGLDEWCLTQAAQANLILNGRVKNLKLPTELLGCTQLDFKDLKGGDAKTNAQIILDILNGKEGPFKNIVIVNAALAIYCAKLIEGDTGFFLEDAGKAAQNSIRSGTALKKLNDFKEWSHKI